MLGVPAHGLRERGALDVAAAGHEVGGGLGVGHRLHGLRDDRALVQVGGHVVGGGADELHAAFVRLVVGAGALEGGQERVVDVDGHPGQVPAQLVREDLHVAGQDHQLDVELGDQVAQPVLRGLLGVPARGVLGDGHVDEGHAVEGGERLQVQVVRDHHGDLDGQGAGALLEEQVVEGVPVLGAHHEGAHAVRRVPQAHAHAELLAHRRERLLDVLPHGRGHELHAHEEVAGVRGVVLLRLGDVRLHAQQGARHGVHDALAVRAGQREHVGVLRAGGGGGAG